MVKVPKEEEILANQLSSIDDVLKMVGKLRDAKMSRLVKLMRRRQREETRRKTKRSRGD